MVRVPWWGAIFLGPLLVLDGLGNRGDARLYLIGTGIFLFGFGAFSLLERVARRPVVPPARARTQVTPTPPNSASGSASVVLQEGGPISEAQLERLILERMLAEVGPSPTKLLPAFDPAMGVSPETRRRQLTADRRQFKGEFPKPPKIRYPERHTTAQTVTDAVWAHRSSCFWAERLTKEEGDVLDAAIEAALERAFELVDAEPEVQRARQAWHESDPDASDAASTEMDVVTDRYFEQHYLSELVARVPEVMKEAVLFQE